MTSRSGWLRLALVLGGMAGEVLAADTLRIITYNIRQGKGQKEISTPEVDIKLPFGLRIHVPSMPIPLARGKGQLDRIAVAMQRCFPDVVCLQEVNDRSLQTLGRDQAGYLARKLKMNHVFALSHTDGKIVKRQGNAILSRYPLGEQRVAVLSPAKDGNERRIALFARVMVPGCPEGVWVCSTHVEANAESVRVDSVAPLVAAVGQMPGPMILAGDFNASPSSQPMRDLYQAMKEIGRPLTDAFREAGHGPGETSGAPVGRYRIDYVFSTAEFKPLHAESPRHINESDHFAVVADLEPVAGPTETAARPAPAGADVALLGVSMR